MSHTSFPGSNERCAIATTTRLHTSIIRGCGGVGVVAAGFYIIRLVTFNVYEKVYLPEVVSLTELLLGDKI